MSQPQDKSQRPRRPPMRRGNNFSDTSGHTQARRPPMGRRQDPGPAAAPTQSVQQPASNQPNPMPAQFPIVPQPAVPYFPAAQHTGLLIRQVPLQFPQPVGGQPMPQTGPTGAQASGSGGTMPSTAQTSADQAQTGPPASGGAPRRPPIPQQQQARFNPQFPGVPALSQQQIAQMQQTGMIPQMLVQTGAVPQTMVGIPNQVPSTVPNGSGVPATGGVGVSQPAAATQPQAPPTGPAVVPAATTTAPPTATESSPKRRGEPWGSKSKPMLYGWATVRQVSSGQSLQIQCRKFYKSREKDQTLASNLITLLLDCIVCPSIGRRKRKESGSADQRTVEFTPDEPFAFEAKEFTRKTLLMATRYNQQPVMFAAWNMTTTKNTKSPRYFGDIYIPNPDGGAPRSLSLLIVQAGFADLKVNDRGDRPPGNLHADEYDRLRQALENAKSHGVGKFQPGNEEKHKRNCFYTQDCRATLRKYRGQTVNAIVDYVVDGCTLRVEICPPGTIDERRESNLQVRLAGVRIEKNYGSNRGADDQLDRIADEAKTFVENALLDHDVQLKFVTADERNLYAQVLHPSGRRIAVALLGQGMAAPTPWVQKEIQDAVEVAEMKAALQVAQQKKIRIWQTKQVTEANVQMEFVTVVRVLSGDKLEVRYHNGNNSREIIRLSSIRAPTRQQNGEMEDWFRAAKEFLRSKTIGKEVQMYKDYEREQKMNDTTISQAYATIYVGNQENVAQSLLQKGLAKIIPHGPKDDPSRDYIKLHEAFDQAQRSKNYKLDKKEDEPAPLDFSNQDRPPSGGRGAGRGQRGGGQRGGGGRGQQKGGGRGGKRNPDARKRVQLFMSLKNQSRPTKCIVEMIFSSTKFKLYVESANAYIPFQLMHIRCDRAPPPNVRNAITLPPGRSSGRPGLDAWRYVFDNLMQREVYINVLETADNVAKGHLYYNGGKNIAEEMIELGLAEVYTWRPRTRDAQRPISAPPKYEELQDAAMQAKLGIWRKIVHDEDVDEKEKGVSSKIGQELSVVISHIESATEFFVNLEEHSAKVDEVSLALAAYIRVRPKRFQKDRVYVGRYNGHWSRCKTIKRNATKDNSWFVIFMDYGNRAAIGEENMGACPPDFKDTSPEKYPPLAIRCQLAGLRPPPKREHQELFNMTGEFFANNVLPPIDSDQSKVLRFKVLYDTEILPQFRRRGAIPSLWGELFDKEMSINKMMVREGYARLDENKNLMLLTNVEDDETTEYVNTIKTLQRAAFDSRTHIWMSGDINTDDEGE